MKKRVFHPAAAKLSGRTREMTGLALRDFLRCGIAGWCLEILFTSVEAGMRGDPKLMGTTSVIMFPIYGAGALLPRIAKWCDWWLDESAGSEKANKDKLSPAVLKFRHGLIYMVAYLYRRIYSRFFSDGQRTLSLGLFPVAGSDPRSHSSCYYPLLVWDRPAF